MIYFDWKPYLRLALLGAGLLTLGLVIWPAKADAAIQCGPHTRMAEVLAEKYLEAPKANGTTIRRVMEAFVSKAGSWTILITSADGKACIIASGEDWEDVPWLPGLKP